MQYDRSVQPSEKPGMVTTIATLTLISGILNIVWAIGLTATVVIGTIGIGLICVPVTILPAVLGIFEILYGMKLIANPPQPVKPNQTIAILEIATVLVGNVLSMVVGILALVFYNDQKVKDYFAFLSTLSPTV